MSDGVWTLLAGILVVTIIFVLVRPPEKGKASPAAGAIQTVTQSLSDLISLAIHGTNKGKQ